MLKMNNRYTDLMTPELAFKKIKAEWQDKKFMIHTCSKCEYICGYIWIRGKLYYDSGCHCLSKRIVERREEKELLNFLRINPEITAVNFGLAELKEDCTN